MFAVSIVMCIAGVALGLAFRLATALRLSAPLLYALVVAFFFPNWAHENQTLSMLILYALLGLCVLSWGISLIRKIQDRQHRRAYERLETEMLIDELKRKQGIAD